MSLHFTVPNRTDESNCECVCMKKMLNSSDYEKFVCLNPKQKMFFENICLRSYNDIHPKSLKKPFLHDAFVVGKTYDSVGKYEFKTVSHCKVLELTFEFLPRQS